MPNMRASCEIRASYRPLSGRIRNFNHPEQPVVGPSWHEATQYCEWLSASTGGKYRLPTEAGGSGRRAAVWKGRYSLGRPHLTESLPTISIVGELAPSSWDRSAAYAFGLFDICAMSTNGVSIGMMRAITRFAGA